MSLTINEIGLNHSNKNDNIITDLIKALLGNSSVNTFQHAAIEVMSQ
jgi:hypothetical protein